MRKDELIDWIVTMHLQNNTNKHDTDASFTYGVECAINELVDLKLLKTDNKIINDNKSNCNIAGCYNGKIDLFYDNGNYERCPICNKDILLKEQEDRL